MKKSLVYYLSQIEQLYPEVEDIKKLDFVNISAEIEAQFASGEQVTAHQKLYSKTYRFLKWFATYYEDNGFDDIYFADYLSTFQLKILETINRKVSRKKWYPNFDNYKVCMHQALTKYIEDISNKTDLENVYAEKKRTKYSLSVQDLIDDEVIKETYQNLLDEVALNELNNLVNSAVTTLNPREQSIVKYYFGMEGPQRSLQKIADEFNISKERVRIILQKAIDKLRADPQNYVKLKDYINH